MNSYRRLTIVLILLLLASPFAEAFHHHEGIADDPHCPICVVSHHHQAISQSTEAFEGTPFVTETTSALPATNFIEHIAVSLLKNRAPPA